MMKNTRKLFLGKTIIISVFFLIFGFSVASAQNITPPDIKIKFFDETGFNTPSPEACSGNQTGNCLHINWIGQHVGNIFRYGISIAIALAVVMIMIGGLLWLMSGGRQDQIGRAKEFITGALSGLLLALFSVIILQAINPGLVDFAPLSINQIDAPEPSPGVVTDSRESQVGLIWSLNEMFGVEAPDEFQIPISSSRYSFNETINVTTINRDPTIYDIDISGFSEDQIGNLMNYIESLQSFSRHLSTDLHSLYIFSPTNLRTQAVQDLIINNP